MHLFEECLDGIVFAVIVSLVMLFSFSFLKKRLKNKNKAKKHYDSFELQVEVALFVYYYFEDQSADTQYHCTPSEVMGGVKIRIHFCDTAWYGGASPWAEV